MKDVIELCRELKRSEEYKQINPEDLDNAGESLSDLTIKINNYITQEIIDRFPNTDEEAKAIAENLPFDKMVLTLEDGQKMPKKRQSVSKLIREISELSKKYIPIWYNEKGKVYFEYSHADKFLNHEDKKF